MILLVVVAVVVSTAQTPTPRPTWPLRARKAWSDSSQFEKVRDRTQSWRDDDTTECYSYNDRYAQATVFCDRECIREHQGGELGVCNGPWYCSKSVICQNDKRLGIEKEDYQRDCVVVRGCANHSQCFPNEGQALASNLERTDTTFTQRVEKSGYKVSFGGVEMKTFCCTNKKSYSYQLNQPCNSATRPPNFSIFLLVAFIVVVSCTLYYY